MLVQSDRKPLIHRPYMHVVNTGMSFPRMAALVLLCQERLGIQVTSYVNLLSFRYYLNRFKAAYRQTLIGKYLKLRPSKANNGHRPLSEAIWP